MKTWLLTLLLMGVAGNLLADHIPGDDPVSLVKDTTVHIFADVTENMDRFKANPEELQALVQRDLMPLLDINYAARLVLGRAGRGLPSEKIDEFAESMSTRLISRYSTGLLYFSSEVELQVLPQRGDLNEKLTRVRTRVKLPSGGEAPVDYAFHKTADGWKAFDVIVEGISYVTTYRNQIMPEVQANGIDSVIERLNSGQLKLAE
ncbi:MAG: ABC transporter substrate-binding protein [Xanthomonadales bacterium]|nr:ABC transporter substrate-binding protein [Xanthomonadales bacterium]